ncbi:disulfide bond formation protein B [Halocynthiibacter sp.]|uniref:disulfide bond formation protein B n=1 Tax=Halocynthiibacter sp. TaxID=1979210 RepID=UPI003C685FE7
MNKLLLLLATAGSAAMLLGAFGFQYIGDMAPCKMCIWQRWPHGIAIVAGLLALALKQKVFAIIGALAALTTSLIGLYHAGVEKGLFEGPDSCTSGPVGNLSADELFNQIMSAPLVRCDEIPWDMFGISMAGWNGLISFTLFGLWVLALRRD